MQSVFKTRVIFEDGHYYKRPTVYYMTRDEREEARRDQEHFIRMINEQFGKYAEIASSEVRDDPSGFVIVQKAVAGEILTVWDVFRERWVYDDLQALYDANLDLWKTRGLSLDFLGFDALFSPWRIYNIITDGSRLKLFDFGLFCRYYPRWEDRLQSIIYTPIQLSCVRAILTVAGWWHIGRKKKSR